MTASAFDLQGHRGARGLAPENTLPAFAAALEIGVTTLELDTGVTKDGVVVIHHDRRLNSDIARGPDGRWVEAPAPLIHELTFEQLRRYDVGRLRPGSKTAVDFPEQQPADGARVPRLAELFELVEKAGNATVRFNIETKISPQAPDETLAPEPFALAVIAEIRKAGMEARASIQSFDWRTLQVVQKVAPEIATAYLTVQRRFDNIGAEKPEGSRWTAGYQFREHGSVPRLVKAAGGQIWSVYFGDLDAAKVSEARALGLKVLVWTVNDAPTMRRLLDLGVDGLITDRPDIARKVLAERGLVPR